MRHIWSHLIHSNNRVLSYLKRSAAPRVLNMIKHSFSCIKYYIYHEDFYGLSNNVLHVLGTRLFLYVLASWKLDSAMWYNQNAQVIQCFSSITSVFSNYLFYTNFLSHIYHEDFYGLWETFHDLRALLISYYIVWFKFSYS